MAIDVLKIEGFEEADRALARITDPETRNRAFAGGLRKAGGVVVKRAKELVPKPGYPGDKQGLKPLMDTLATIVKQYATTFVAISGPQRPAGAHGHLVEGGTKQHGLRAGVARGKATGKKAIAANGVIYGQRVRHPGATPRPFMRPAAVDTKAQQEAAIIEGINRLVES